MAKKPVSYRGVRKNNSNQELASARGFGVLVTIVVYLGCTIAGFGIAFMIAKLLLEMSMGVR